MKKLAIAMTVAVLFGVFAIAASAVDGLVGYYSFEDAGNLLKDYSSAGNDMTAPNDGIEQVDAKVGKGVKLDGISAYLHWENINGGSSDSFTFSFWVYFNEFYLQDLNTMFSGDGWTDHPGNLHCHMKSDTTSAFGFSDSTPTPDNTGDYAFDIENWYHITLVTNIDEATVTYYVNGEEVVESIYSGISPVWLGSGSIGCWNNNGAPERFCDAIFDEIKFYNRALTAEEVKTIMNETTAVDASAPAAAETEAPAEAEAPAAVEAPVTTAPKTFDAVIITAVAALAAVGTAIVSKKK